MVPAGPSQRRTARGLSAGKLITQTGSIFGTRYGTGAVRRRNHDGRRPVRAGSGALRDALAGVHPITAKSTLQVISHQLATPTPSFQSVAPQVEVPAALQDLVIARADRRRLEKRPENATPVLLATLVCRFAGQLSEAPAPHPPRSQRSRLTPTPAAAATPGPTISTPAVRPPCTQGSIASRTPPPPAVPVPWRRGQLRLTSAFRHPQSPASANAPPPPGPA